MRVTGKVPKPGSLEHTAMITASKIPAVLGISPWTTPNELWQSMVNARRLLEDGKSRNSEADEGWVDRFAWGHIAEQALCDFWRADRDRILGRDSVKRKRDSRWSISRGEVVFTDPSLGCPNVVTVDRIATPKHKDAGVVTILECKTSSNPQAWEQGIPDHYFWQVLCQMGVSKIHTATLIAQVGQSVPVFYEVPWDEDAWQWLRDQVELFWHCVEEETPPVAISDQYVPSAASLEGAVELPADLVERYQEAKTRAHEADAALKQQKAELTEFMLQMGAKDGTYLGKKVTRRTAGRFSVKNLPAECKQLATDERYMSLKFDASKLKQDRPDIYEASLSQPSWSLS